MLVSVDGLRQQEMQVVQGHGGDEGQHSVLVGDLHGNVDSGREKTGVSCCGPEQPTGHTALSALENLAVFLPLKFSMCACLHVCRYTCTTCLHVLLRKLEADVRRPPGSHSASRRGLLLSLELTGLAVLASHTALVNPSL